jgi:hypothetical protein
MTININHIDVELLNRLRENDTQAFESIYKKYWQNLYLTAFSILKDKQASEDIIQDLFIQLWNKRATISVTVSLNAYLSASIKHEVFSKPNILKPIIQLTYTKPIIQQFNYMSIENKTKALKKYGSVSDIPYQGVDINKL